MNNDYLTALLSDVDALHFIHRNIASIAESTLNLIHTIVRTK